jgi:hypothetical protein
MALDSTPATTPDPSEPADSAAVGSEVPSDGSRATATRSPRHRLVLRVAITLGLVVGLLIAGGGVDGAQHAFAHMFPTDENACGGG